jgi:DNA-binding transcriptional LysR family regulator
LVSVLPTDLKLEDEKLLENKLFLVGSKSLVIDPKTKIEEVFANHPLIYREDGSATRMAMEHFLNNRGIAIGMKFQLTSNEAVKQSLIAGLGISIMPLIGLKNELERGELKIIPVKGLPITTDWRLVWLKNKALSPIAKAYLDFIQEKKEAISDQSFSWIKTIIPQDFH